MKKQKQTKALNIRIDAELKERIEQQAAKERRSLTSYVEVVLEEQLKNNG